MTVATKDGEPISMQMAEHVYHIYPVGPLVIGDGENTVQLHNGVAMERAAFEYLVDLAGLRRSKD
jgi:hypothetical protein